MNCIRAIRSLPADKIWSPGDFLEVTSDHLSALSGDEQTILSAAFSLHNQSQSFWKENIGNWTYAVYAKPIPGDRFYCLIEAILADLDGLFADAVTRLNEGKRLSDLRLATSCSLSASAKAYFDCMSSLNAQRN